MRTKSILDTFSWLILICQLFLSGVIMFTASAIPLRWHPDGSPEQFVAPWHIVWVMLTAILLFVVVSVFERRKSPAVGGKRVGDGSLMECLLAWFKVLSLFVLLYITWVAYQGDSISFIVPGAAFGLLLVAMGVYVIRYSSRT